MFAEDYLEQFLKTLCNENIQAAKRRYQYFWILFRLCPYKFFSEYGSLHTIM